MKPSVAASFLTFCLVGFLTLKHHNFNTEEYTSFWLILVIICSSLYYYYLNVAADNKWKIENQTKKRGIISWFVLVIQYAGFYSLWLLFKEDLVYYAFGIFLINFSYIAWDIINFKIIFPTTEGKVLLGADIIGVLITLIFWYASFELPRQIPNNYNEALKMAHINQIATIIVFKTTISLIIMILIFKYNPFKLLDMNGNHIKYLNRG